MKARSRWFVSIAVAMTAFARAPAMSAPVPIMRHTFEEDAGGWMAFGPNSKVSVTQEAAHVKEGKAALQFDYSIGKGEMAALIRTTDWSKTPLGQRL